MISREGAGRRRATRIELNEGRREIIVKIVKVVKKGPNMQQIIKGA